MYSPISSNDLMLVFINAMSFFIVQTLFFVHIGSKTNLGVTKEIIGTVRDMIKNVTYNKIDLIDYLETTPEQLDELDDIINHRNDYNNKVINKLYSFLKYSGLGIFLFYIFSPSTNSYGQTEPLYKTFGNTTDILLIVITILFYASEYYLYARFISRSQLITAFDFIEDPDLYDDNLKKFQNYNLSDIYNDIEIQIINQINNYIKLIKSSYNSINYGYNNMSALIHDFKNKSLKNIQSAIESDKNIQYIINKKTLIQTKLSKMKSNYNYIQHLTKMNDNYELFNDKLNNLENQNYNITNKLNNSLTDKINNTLLNTYNKYLYN